LSHYRVEQSGLNDPPKMVHRSTNAITNNAEKSLIAIHNHPTNILLDGADYVSLGYRKYSEGVVVTHNGKVYTYNVGNRPFTSGVLD